MKEFTFIKDKDSQVVFYFVSILILCLGFFVVIFSSLKSVKMITDFSSFVKYLSDEIGGALLVFIGVRYGIRLGLSRRYKVKMSEKSFRLFRRKSEFVCKEILFTDIQSVWFVSEKNLYGDCGNILVFQKGFRETLLLSDFGGQKESFREMIEDITKSSRKRMKEIKHLGSIMIFFILGFWK